MTPELSAFYKASAVAVLCVCFPLVSFALLQSPAFPDTPWLAARIALALLPGVVLVAPGLGGGRPRALLCLALVALSMLVAIAAHGLTPTQPLLALAAAGWAGQVFGARARLRALMLLSLPFPLPTVIADAAGWPLPPLAELRYADLGPSGWVFVLLQWLTWGGLAWVLWRKRFVPAPL